MLAAGVVSDMMHSRKSAITLGFAMGACAKFGMSGATTVAHLFSCKAVDRLANGVQVRGHEWGHLSGTPVFMQGSGQAGQWRAGEGA